MHYKYPARIEAEEGGQFTAYFDGLPGATWGQSREEALFHARDLLANALEMLTQDRETIPPAPPANGRPMVEAEVATPAPDPSMGFGRT